MARSSPRFGVSLCSFVLFCARPRVVGVGLEGQDCAGLNVSALFYYLCLVEQGRQLDCSNIARLDAIVALWSA